MKDELQDKKTQEKVEQLLSTMNLPQKIGQMTQTERLTVSPAEVKEYHLGSVLSGGGSAPGKNLPSDWLAMCDEYWLASMEEDDQHLAIPLIYGVDAVHGHNNVRGATLFPHNIGLGAANDPELMLRISLATANEIQATGVDWTFDPALSVARNVRWGRTYESYSEDPEIVTSYAAPVIQGLQSEGDTIACVKHWLGDGGTQYGMDQGDTVLTEAELQKKHLAPYLPALDAGVLTVMASFNSWNGDKCHGHQYLLTDKLKHELGFMGFVISDWDGADYLADDYSEAIAKAVIAGVDMFMVSEKWKTFLELLTSLVQNGSVPMSRIDDAVSRILRVKFAAGLFDKPQPSKRHLTNQSSYGTKYHREISREAVRKSLVLLKNENEILPLDKNLRLLVAGKNAHDRGNQCGGWSISWQGTSGNDHIEGGTSIWEGIQKVAPNAVLSSDGAEADPAYHDAAVVVIGETPYAEGFGDIRDGDRSIIEVGSRIRGRINPLEPYGKTLQLSKLHPEDLKTILNITNKGIPTVVILITGRPLIINKELREADAFITAWLPGSEGQGIADVIFGDFNFQGKLSFSWPEHEDDNYNRGDDEYHPLFEYGFGMTYSDRKIEQQQAQ